jgi:hypothetical protein
MYRTDGRAYIAMIMVMAALVFPVVGAIGVEAAIQRRILATPQLDMWVGPIYIRASSSVPQQVPACPYRSPSLYVPIPEAACSQQFYVVLVLIQTGALDDKPWILQLLNVSLKGN